MGTGNVFDTGNLEVTFQEISAAQSGLPVPVRLWFPSQPGEYAVVIFQHGFLMSSAWYSRILSHLASHGYIVLGPQMYAADGIPLGKPTSAEEAANAAQVRAWVNTGLGQFTGPAVPSVDHVGYAGHSRGGKVAWLVLKENPQLAKAVAGLDPVDGTGGPLGGEARVISGDFNFPFPSYVLGSGLGPQSSGFNQPCAPAGDNSVQFYGASAAPAWHIIATAYGHNDLLDPDASCGMTCSVCSSGPEPALFLNLVQGHVTAFFRGSLQGVVASFETLSDIQSAPVDITVESR